MKRFIVYAVFLMVFMLSMNGCWLLLAGAAGGAGTAVWLANKLTSEVDASYDRTITAAKSALASLDMPLVKETRSTTVDQLISEDVDGSKVWIDIRPVTAETTEVAVRVGIDGDEETSSRILGRIKQEL